MYFRAGWKELTEVVNWLSSYPLDEVVHTEIDETFVNIRFWSVVVGET